jgi:HSP20 family protein
MHSTLALMRDQVRAIYRAITGEDMPEEGVASPEEHGVSPDDVARRFAELEAITRSIPVLTERIPPFSFAPLLDVIDSGNELLIEVAVPGVGKEDILVELSGGQLILSGVRRGERAANGRVFYHAEIPRGPFYRVVPLPYPIVGEPRVEVRQGLIYVHLSKAQNGAEVSA